MIHRFKPHRVILFAVIGSAMLSWMMTVPLAQAQNPGAPTSSTLRSDSPTLILPGSLTFTSVVSSTPAAPGVPTGGVSFFYDAGQTNLIGTALLTLVPGSQTLSQLTPFATGTSSPGTLASAKLTSGTYPDIVVGTPGPNNPALLLYPGLGRGLFDTTNFQTFYLNQLTVADTIDSSAVGSFTAPGSVDLLVHTYNYMGSSTYSLLSNQPAGLATSVSVAYTFPTSALDIEKIVTDDFNGDGLDDVAYAIPGQHFGVSLNSAKTPGTLATPNSLYVAGGLCPEALASGRYTASGHSDLIMAATQCASAGPPTGYVLLFAGDGAGGFGPTVQGTPGLTVTPATQVTVSGNPIAIAVGDFNKDGKLDVVVADNTGNSIQVLYGNGDGTFQSTIATFSAVGTPTRLAVGDFNGDGYPDVAVTLSSGGSVAVLYNDGKGGLIVPSQAFTTPAASLDIISGDLNSDGYADIAFLTDIADAVPLVEPAVNVLLTSGSSQAVLVSTPQSIPAGSHTVTAYYPGTPDFAGSTSPSIQETVTQTVPGVVWLAPASILYGTPLSAVQLNAAATIPGTFTYTPAAGTLLPPGSATLSVLFTPTDAFDYTTVMASQSLSIAPPTLASISPVSGSLGDTNTTLTVVGQGFVTGALVLWDGAPVATTFVDSRHLTASIPSTLLQTVGTYSVTVVDANGIPVVGTQTFTVGAPPVVVSASGPATIGVTQQSLINLSLNPYPVPITVTATLTFVPAPPNTINDPTVVFANGSPTFTESIPPLDANTIPPISFQSGSSAGTITITVRLTAGGTDITPASLVPIVIFVPAAPPAISTVTLTRTGKTLQMAIVGLSSTREISQAQFHFVAASGQTLTTTDVTVPLTSVFSAWYQGGASTPFGTQFMYTQPFALDSDASVVSSVTVILTNSQGASAPSNAQ